MSLKEYQRKRKFDRTPEPRAKQRPKSVGKPLFFVVQKHDATRTHYDFRLEINGVLKSWAVPKGPSLSPQSPRLAVKVEDHPLAYGKFEGVIQKGNYGAGTVLIWDWGSYTERRSVNRKQSEKALEEGLKEGHLTFILQGQKLRGEFALIKLKKKGAPPNGWLLIKKHDAEASRLDILKEAQSVASGRSMEEIAAQAPKKGEVWVPGRAKNPAHRRPVKTSPPEDKPYLTHLDKIYWPEQGYTKGDLIQYYEQVAPVLLPHLKDRPQSLRRQPHGIRNPGFFQKDMTGFLPRKLQTVRVVSQSAGRTIDYALCQDRWSLLYLVNLGCIELNPWLSRQQHLDYPDCLVIDLDPGGTDFDVVIEVAKETHRVLTSVGAKSYCKTSGASGLHVCVPLGARFNYEEAREFAESVCKVVHQKHPLTTSLERNPLRRRGRIYLDFLQNRRGQTLAAPYCVRPRPKATISTPLKWTEVKRGLRPERFTIETMKRRLERVGDLWKPMLRASTDLRACRRKLSKLYHI